MYEDPSLEDLRERARSLSEVTETKAKGDGPHNTRTIGWRLSATMGGKTYKMSAGYLIQAYIQLIPLLLEAKRHMMPKLFKDLMSAYIHDTQNGMLGLGDPVRRDEIAAHMKSDPDFIKDLTVWMRDELLSDERLQDGYTVEDVFHFLNWLEWGMDFSL